MIVLAVTVIGAGSRKVVDVILNMTVALPRHFATTGSCAGWPRWGGLLSKELFRRSRQHRCNRRNLAKKTSPSVSFHEYLLNSSTGASQHRRKQVICEATLVCVLATVTIAPTIADPLESSTTQKYCRECWQKQRRPRISRSRVHSK